MIYKTFYYHGRKHKISEYGDIVRCEYKDVRIQKYNGRCVKLLRTNKEKQMKTSLTKDGYLCLKLTSNNHVKCFPVHHLVHMVFNENIKNVDNGLGYSFKDKNYVQINHKDSNKLNNHYTNLEKVTLQENIDHSVRNMTHNSQMKAKYIDVFKNGKYITTVWKFKGLSKYLSEQLNYTKLINRGSLYKYLINEKDFHGYTFRYKV